MTFDEVLPTMRILSFVASAYRDGFEYTISGDQFYRRRPNSLFPNPWEPHDLTSDEILAYDWELT